MQPARLAALAAAPPPAPYPSPSPTTTTAAASTAASNAVPATPPAAPWCKLTKHQGFTASGPPRAGQLTPAIVAYKLASAPVLAIAPQQPHSATQAPPTLAVLPYPLMLHSWPQSQQSSAPRRLLQPPLGYAKHRPGPGAPLRWLQPGFGVGTGRH